MNSAPIGRDQPGGGDSTSAEISTVFDSGLANLEPEFIRATCFRGKSCDLPIDAYPRRPAVLVSTGVWCPAEQAWLDHPDVALRLELVADRFSARFLDRVSCGGTERSIRAFEWSDNHLYAAALLARVR